MIDVKRMTKSSIDEKLALIHEQWRPKVIAQLNGQEVKLAKIEGVFPWHHHDTEDEFFLVWRGTMFVEYRDYTITLNAGEFHVVPHGTEHRTKADTEAWIMIFEPADLRNTGNVIDETFTAPMGVVI